MGYNTRYTLNVEHTKLTLVEDTLKNDLEIIKDLRNTCEEAKFALNEHGGSYDNTKWYNHEDDLVKFSQKYPSIIFTLSGVGEEPGDVWEKYFKNGKKQIAKATIMIDPFDESKLK